MFWARWLRLSRPSFRALVVDRSGVAWCGCGVQLLAAFFGLLWGVCSGCGYLSMYAAVEASARLVVAPGAMAPAVASASCQHFGADRLGVV